MSIVSNFRPRLLVAALLVSGLSACATGPTASRNDPLEPMNREIYRINEDLDAGILRPVARLYVDYVPSPIRTAVSNVFSNFGDVYSVVNNALQGKPAAAAEDTMRVAMNSVLGLGGLIDIATPAGLPKHKEDFGQTLGVWGVSSGPYLVLPILGPSSVRDAVGTVVDAQIDPGTYIDPVSLRNSVVGLRVVDARARLLGATSLLETAALDKYSFLRDSYLQRRNYLVHDGNPPVSQNEATDTPPPPEAK